MSEDDWQNEIESIKKLKRKGKVRFIISPKNIEIPNRPKAPALNDNLPNLEPVSKKLLPRNFIPEARIDLHGYTLEQAHMELTNFVKNSYNQNRRQLLIITGRGGKDGKIGLIKKLFPLWLNEQPLRSYIISFFISSREYGGEGAYFVILKKIMDR